MAMARMEDEIIEALCLAGDYDGKVFGEVVRNGLVSHPRTSPGDCLWPIETISIWFTVEWRAGQFLAHMGSRLSGGLMVATSFPYREYQLQRKISVRVYISVSLPEPNFGVNCLSVQFNSSDASRIWGIENLDPTEPTIWTVSQVKTWIRNRETPIARSLLERLKRKEWELDFEAVTAIRNFIQEYPNWTLLIEGSRFVNDDPERGWSNFVRWWSNSVPPSAPSLFSLTGMEMDSIVDGSWSELSAFSSGEVLTPIAGMSADISRSILSTPTISSPREKSESSVLGSIISLAQSLGIFASAVAEETNEKPVKANLPPVTAASPYFSPPRPAIDPRRRAVDPRRQAVDPRRQAVDPPIEDAMVCKICFNQKITHIYVPCGHRCACFECGKDLTTCPICRVPRTNFMEMF